MKLQQFIINSRVATPGVETSAPIITLCRGNGRIYFDTATTEIMGLSSGDMVAFYFDPANNLGWYLAKVDKGTENAAELIAKGGSARALEFNHCRLTGELMSAAKAYASCKLLLKPITIEDRGMWQIVTDKPLKTDNGDSSN